MKLFEILDLYKLHSDPKSIKGHDVAYEKVPGLAWKKYKDQPDELKKREDLWSKGEDAIAKDPYFAYLYAHDVLKKPFPKGEDAIVKQSGFSYWYAHDVL